MSSRSLSTPHGTMLGAKARLVNHRLEEKLARFNHAHIYRWECLPSAIHTTSISSPVWFPPYLGLVQCPNEGSAGA